MKEGKVFKRILAIALVVVMTITMMPFGVFATGEETTTPDTGSSEVVTPTDPEAPADPETPAEPETPADPETPAECAHLKTDTVYKKKDDPTCTKDGVKAYYLCKCGAKVQYPTLDNPNVVTDEHLKIPATGHTIVNNDAQDATCIAVGWAAYESCSKCNYTTKVEIPATGHTEENIEAIPATCTTTGMTAGKKCSVCNTVTEKPEVAEMVPHTGGTATCIALAECSVCHQSYGVLGDHNYGDATCAEAAKCTVCNTSTGAPLGHVDAEAPCGDQATCSRCNQKFGPFGQHTEEDIPAVEATCTRAGNEAGKKCSKCNVVTVPATPIAMKAHGYSKGFDLVAEVPATCEEAGTTAGKFCKDCNQYVEGHTAIPATGHEWSTTDISKDANQHGKKCSKCNEYKDLVNHNFVVSETTPATCIATGLVEKDCACGANNDEILPIDNTAHSVPTTATFEKVSATQHGKKCSLCNEYTALADHAYTTEVAKTLATCVSEGSVTNKCICTDEKTEVIPVNDNHNYPEGWTVVTNATCEEKGKQKKVCQRDDEHVLEEDIAALGHATVKVAAKAATCKEDGNIEYYTCSRCPKLFKDAAGKIEASADEVKIAKGEHTFTTYTVSKDATCEANAFEKATCDVCEEATNEREIAGTKVAHLYKTYVSNNDATCIADGTTTATCEICKVKQDTKTDTGSKANAAHTPDAKNEKCTLCGAELTCLHVYSAEKLITKTPTCTEKGQEAIVCSKCNAHKPGSEVELPATGHAWDEGTVTKEATCKEKGSKTLKCNNLCGTTEVKEIEKTAHNYKEEITHATCLEDGYTTFTCTMCGSYYADKVVKAYGHMFETYFYDEGSATCYQDGTKTAECANGCGEKNTVADPGSKTDHEMTDFTVITEATCLTDGEEEAKCFYYDHCGYSELVPVDALGHDESGEFETTIAATCTEKGTEVKKCVRCEEVIDTQDIAALGHDESGELVEVLAATCTAEGSKEKKCVRCSEVVATEAIPALGHDIAAEYTTDVAATCLTAGKQSKHCSRCDYKDGEVEIPATGHDMQPTEGTTATCTEPGKAVFACANGCGETKTESNSPALGHDYAYVSNGDATCTADGTKTGKCKRCDATDTTDDIGSKLEHVIGEPVIVKATKENNGLITIKCANCDYEEAQDIAKIDSLKLKYTSVVYDGKYKRPSLTITDAEGEKLVKGEDYLLELPAKEDCINAGTYTYKVTFIGNYEGEETLTYKVVPGKASKIVSKDTKQTYISLKWSTVKGADGYRIYVKTSSGSWKKLATVKGTTSYKVKDLKAGTKYTFAVKAFSKSEDGKTTFWAEEFAEQSFKTLPGKTSSLTAKTSKNAVKLTWKEVKGADGYRVYVKTAKGGWKTVSTVKGKTTYTVKDLKANTTYEYAVKAYYKDGSATVWSNQYKTVKAKTTTK